MNLNLNLNLQELIHFAIYKSADLNSPIPDVDQIAEFLYQELKITNINLLKFKTEFLEFLAQKELLQSAFFDEVILFFQSLNLKLKQNFLISSWTQGNVFLQTQKALVFQDNISEEFLAKPSIYASLEKINILPFVAEDLLKQNCDFLCLIDDRLENVCSAYEKLTIQNNITNILYIHKIRPDKPIKAKLTNNQKKQNLQEITEWTELINILEKHKSQRIGFILDKDGIIYNSTKYRKQLETLLIKFCQKFV